MIYIILFSLIGFIAKFYIVRKVYINNSGMIDIPDLFLVAIPLVGIIVAIALIPYAFSEYSNEKFIEKVLFIKDK